MNVYTRAAYETFKVDYTGATPQLDCSGQEKGAGNVIDLSCIPFQSTPKQQFSLSGRYNVPLDRVRTDDSYSRCLCGTTSRERTADVNGREVVIKSQPIPSCSTQRLLPRKHGR